MYTSNMRFVDPATENFERQEGHIRHEIELVSPFTGELFPMIVFRPEGATVDDVFEHVGRLGVTWISMQQLDSTPASISIN